MRNLSYNTIIYTVIIKKFLVDRKIMWRRNYGAFRQFDLVFVETWREIQNLMNNNLVTVQKE